MTVDVIHGDCVSVMLAMPEASFDAIVTDPPYHLSSIVKRFGKKGSAPAQYGKDGAFARASRGFMGKQWDGGDVAFRVETWEAALRVLKPGGHVLAFSGTRTYHRMVCAIDDAGFEVRDQIGWCFGSGFPKSHDVSKEASQWQGWGTALKPAWEPIVVARKPLRERTVAANVLAHGTGALNIDACRIGTTDSLGGGMVSKGRPKVSEGWDRPWMHDPEITERKKAEAAAKVAAAEDLGRWPANIVHDGSDEVLAAFAEFGEKTSGKMKPTHTNGRRNVYGKNVAGGYMTMETYGDSGTAARFFYSAKATAEDRLGSRHPTIKPIDLMAWLCRLVTPPGGHILDPFAGSGTTGMAAMREGFNATLIELELDSVQDIKRRIEHVHGADAPLFRQPKTDLAPDGNMHDLFSEQEMRA